MNNRGNDDDDDDDDDDDNSVDYDVDDDDDDDRERTHENKIIIFWSSDPLHPTFPLLLTLSPQELPLFCIFYQSDDGNGKMKARSGFSNNRYWGPFDKKAAAVVTYKLCLFDPSHSRRLEITTSFDFITLFEFR